jgi:hypothetical protein
MTMENTTDAKLPLSPPLPAPAGSGLPENTLIATYRGPSANQLEAETTKQHDAPTAMKMPIATLAPNK